MYVQFYQYMQSAEYRQDLEQEIADETVRIVTPFRARSCVVLISIDVSCCCGLHIIVL